MHELTNQAVDWHSDGRACAEPEGCRDTTHLPAHGLLRVELIGDDESEWSEAVCFCGQRMAGAASYHGAVELLYDEHVYPIDAEERASEQSFRSALAAAEAR